MAHVLAETTRIKIRGTDGHVHEFCLSYDTEETSGIPYVLLHAYRDGELAGTPIRFKDASGRIAADFPSVNSAHFITDGNGSITNG